MVVRRVPQAEEDYAELVGTADPAAVAVYEEAGWEVLPEGGDSDNVREGRVTEPETVLGWRKKGEPRYPKGFEPLSLPG